MVQGMKQLREVLRSRGPLLVAVGTAAGPASQWIVFWLIARNHGSAGAGEFAWLLAISTPIFTLCNFGLRDTFITATLRHRFVDYAALRVFTTIIGIAGMVGMVGLLSLNGELALAVAVMKAADAALDLTFAWYQRARMLPRFGGLMILNGAATALFAGIAAAARLDSAGIAAGSSAGSLLTAGIAAWVLLRHRAHSSPPQVAIRLATFSREQIAKIVLLSWPVALAQVLTSAAIYVPMWLVRIAGSQAEIGRFAAASYLLTFGALIGAGLNMTYIGEFQSLAQDEGPEAMVRVARRRIRAVTTGGLLFALLLTFVGNWLFTSIYGAAFGFSGAEILVIALAAALSPGTYLMSACLLTLNRYHAQLVIVGWSLTASILVSIAAVMLPAYPVLLGGLAALGGGLVKFFLSRRAIIGVAKRHLAAI